MTATPQRIRITDVAPRDGLQNESGVIPARDKAELVGLLCDAGVDEVEVSSFVSAKWVPQLGDAEEVFALARARKRPGVIFSALAPNERGLEALLRVNASVGSRVIDKVALFTAASESFCRKNINATIQESLDRFSPMMARLPRDLLSRGYISCAIACPFEGPINPQRVADVAARLVDLGIGEIDLGDTIGAGEPGSVARMLASVQRALGDRAELTLHLHDTFGRAAACIPAALDEGVRSFDSSAGGLGGCPYASTPGRRAPGNIDTELLVRTLHHLGHTTGVRLDKLALASAHARHIAARAREHGGA